MSHLQKPLRWAESQEEAICEIRDLAIARITQPVFTAENCPKWPTDGTKVLTNVLCKACAQILDVFCQLLDEAAVKGHMQWKQIALDHSLRDLTRSAQLGCHMCSLLYGNTLLYMRNGNPSSIEFDHHDTGDFPIYLKTHPFQFEDMVCKFEVVTLYKDGGFTGPGYVLNLSYASNRQQDTHGPVVDLKQMLDRTTNSDVAFKMARTWLETCRNNHDRCISGWKQQPNVPKRLLYLDENQVDVIENNQQLPYVCLSHCWGDPKNIPSLISKDGSKKSISITSLPPTFQDAVAITKKMGLKHLWIDSLCITQDSKEDWKEQSAVMAQIYANSEFTIAALASKDSLGGCFRERNPLIFSALQAHGFVLEPNFKHLFWSLEINGSDFGLSPLQSRAWVVQERLATSRTLSFGTLGIYWECRSMRASENYNSKTADADDNVKSILTDLRNAAIKTAVRSSGVSSSEFYNKWYRLLKIYTDCDLTYPTDKLIAISSIIKAIEVASDRKAIYGLWTDDLDKHLLWLHEYENGTYRPVREGGRYKIEAFPSWSWASMRGQIRRWVGSGRITWRVIPHVEENPLRLRLRTWSREVRLTDSGYLQLTDDGSRTGDLNEEHTWYHDEEHPADTSMYLVLIHQIEVSDKPRIHAAECLVLRPNGDDAYVRTGMAVLRFTSPKGNPFPNLDPSTEGHDIILV